MRILILSGEYPPVLSGMGDYAFHLSRSLRRAGHQVLIVTQGLGPSLETKNAAVENEILYWPGKWSFQSLSFFQKTLQSWKPDIFHLQYMTTTFQNSVFIPFLPFLLKREFSRVKMITTYHEYAAPWKRLALLPLLWGSDAHIVTNDRHFEILKKITGVFGSKKPLGRIPLAANIFPPADPDRLRLVYREKLKLKENEFLLIRFGILHDWSLPELQLLARVFKKIREKGHSVKFLVIGKSEARPKNLFEETLRQLELESSVIVRSDADTEEIAGCIAAADIGLAPYLDGVSEKRTALLALMMRGLPVISTRKGKVPSEFHEGENILTVDLWNEAEWESAIQRLLTEPALRLRLSEGAKKMAAQHDWENIGRMTSEFYKRL